MYPYSKPKNRAALNKIIQIRKKYYHAPVICETLEQERETWAEMALKYTIGQNEPDPWDMTPH